MADQGERRGVPAEVGIRPSPARIYDYLLGGKDNFAADRQAAEAVLAAMPNAAAQARTGRRFHQRAVAMMARLGIRQFIDIGCGLPTNENTHEAAAGAAGGDPVRTAYVDCDEQVVMHARSILARQPGTVAFCGDLREPESVLGSLKLAEVIRRHEPCGLLMTAVVHFIPDENCPYELVRQFTSWIAPGSYVAISHGAGPGRAEGAFRNATMQARSRSTEEVLELFSGLELLPPHEGAAPGIAPVTQWSGDGEIAAAPGSESTAADTLWCGIGRKP